MTLDHEPESLPKMGERVFPGAVQGSRLRKI